MGLTFRESCAIEVLKVFLESDLAETIESQMGADWTVNQAFKIADLMERKNNE